MLSRQVPHDHRRPPRTSLPGFVAAVLVFGVTVGGGGGAGCARGPVRGPALAGSGWTAGGDRLGAGPIAAVALAGDDVIVASDVAAAGGEVRRLGGDGATRWIRPLPARPRALAASPTRIVVAIEGDADLATLTAAGLTGLPDGLRGAPGAAVVMLGADGAPTWTVGVGGTRWAMVRAVVLDGDDVLVGGAFAGTLRIGDRVVTAAGGVDGFWARLDGAGHLVALARMGGDGFDAVTGVAALTDGRLAIVGTFTGPAELAGTDLDSARGDRIGGDGFVATFDRAGALAWARTWGGAYEDTGAGVAALAGGELVVAGTITGEVDVAGRRLTSRGTSDGMVAVLAGDGAVRGVTLVGGPDVDSVTAVASGGAGGHALVAGRYNGAIATRAGTVAAPSADAGFVAVVDRDGVIGLAPVVSAAATVDVRIAADPRGWLAAAHADVPLALGADAQPAGGALWRRAW